MPVRSAFTANVSRCAFVTIAEAFAARPHAREEILRTGQEANLLAMLMLQRLQVHAEIARPMIEAVPLERAHLGLEARRQRLLRCVTVMPCRRA